MQKDKEKVERINEKIKIIKTFTEKALFQEKRKDAKMPK